MFEASLRLACLLVAAFLAAPWPTAALAQEPRPAQGFLWEATRGTERVLLLGSIHVGRADSVTRFAANLPRLMPADVVVFEANVFDAQASMAAMQRWALYPEGAPGLEAHVDAATMARIEKLVARSGASVPVCCRMKPWMVANTLVVLEAMRAGLSPAYGSEAQLYQFALASGRPVVEIEGVESQLRLFAETAPGAQLDYLRYTLDSIDSGRARKEIERLVGAWERGDAAALEAMLAAMQAEAGAGKGHLMDRLVRGRHPRMIAAIERHAASDRLHLVAIGALHFFGPDGLIEGLRERGFAVRRLG